MYTYMDVVMLPHFNDHLAKVASALEIPESVLDFGDTKRLQWLRSMELLRRYQPHDSVEGPAHKGWAFSEGRYKVDRRKSRVPVELPHRQFM